MEPIMFTECIAKLKLFNDFLILYNFSFTIHSVNIMGSHQVRIFTYLNSVSYRPEDGLR